MIYLSMHRRPAYIEVQTDAGLINVHLRLGSLVGPTDKAGRPGSRVAALRLRR